MVTVTKLSDLIRQGKKPIGPFCHLAGTTGVECLCLAGVDYILIDMEHGPFSFESAQDMIRAAGLHGKPAYVRPCSKDRHDILHALDIGAAGLIVPDVESVEEVRQLVDYAKYYPLGRRGFAFSRSAQYGFSPDLQRDVNEYFELVNREVHLLPQCETMGAYEHIGEIVSIPGVDGIFVGPYDLSVAMGHPAKMDLPEFQDCLLHILKTCKDAGKQIWIFAANRKDADAYFELGYDVVTVGMDTAFLVDGCKRALGLA